MKAAGFDYFRAETIDDVCRALADADGEARIIAGGQTLVPLMAMRMARPGLLIDINKIAELAGIRDDGGTVAIGACTRQADALASQVVGEKLKLLAKALRNVGHQQTRNRGTIGGSIANADPSAEIPLVAVTLDAELVARNTGGERRIAAGDFFEAAMMTALAPDDCLVEVRFPVWGGGRTGAGFAEVNVRNSDFALAAAAAQVELDGDGACASIHIGIGGAAPAALRARDAEAALTGVRLDDDAIAKAAASIADVLDPDSDIHAGADYRRRVACVMARRAIAAARDDALGTGGAP
ncbi:MAG: FAD binding domain-containing protein [Alphaproteobacteria bacterium]